MTHPLTKWRERNGVGCAELARRLKCNRRTVYRYEAGEIRPSDEQRVLIEEITDGAVPYASWRPSLTDHPAEESAA